MTNITGARQTAPFFCPERGKKKGLAIYRLCFTIVCQLAVFWANYKNMNTTYSNPNSDPRAGIIRDHKYHHTLKRDLRRQQWRRLGHTIASTYEQKVWVPRWKNAASEKKRLSICIITMNSEHRIGSLLQYLRPFADELVVGVDSKTTDHTHRVSEEFADTVFTIQNDALTCNSGLEALVQRCTGDWVLRLDDDEFPEPHLLKLLPGLVATSKYTHYKLPRLHLSRLNESGNLFWIPDSYLYPDFQMRLFKNDPALLSYPGPVGHTSVMCSGKRGKINTVNLVHLNLAINPREKREAKLRNYIKRLNGGWVHPVNEHALLFEDFNYTEKPYTYPDEHFLLQIKRTITEQRSRYLSEQSNPATSTY